MSEIGSPRIIVSAGEASGDMHGGELVRELTRRHPTWSFSGIGGKVMEESGVQLLHHAQDLGVTGFIEVFNRFPLIRRALRDMKQLIRSQPDLLILVDYPDFNFRLARYAYKRGVPVVYFISPQIWAWRLGRVKKIKRWVTRMLVILPFEVAFYNKFGAPATYVGHPLLDQWAADGLPQPIPANRDALICLLPGSRPNEVKRLLPIMIDTARLIHSDLPLYRFAILQADTISTEMLTSEIKGMESHVSIVSEAKRRTLLSSRLAITASGTATVEIALAGTPMIVIYKMSELTYRIVRRLVKVKYISMVNLLAEAPLVPELIQENACPERIVQESERILTNDTVWLDTHRGLMDVRARLGAAGATARAADAITELLSVSLGERNH